MSQLFAHPTRLTKPRANARHHLILEQTVNVWRDDIILTHKHENAGSHGVTLGREGLLVAPMGSAGLLVMQRHKDGRVDYRNFVLTVDRYFYQTVHLDKDDHGFDWFASACRADGLQLTSIGPGFEIDKSLHSAPSESNPRFDVVSLCPVGLHSYPFALALLGMDGSFYLSKDPRSEGFISMTSDNIGGTPYQIHSAQGHLIILTSSNIYLIQDVAPVALRSNALQPRRPTSDKPPYQNVLHRTISFEVDAVDCAVVNDECLLIIREDRISLTLISELFQPSRDTSPGSREVGGWAGNGYTTSVLQPALDYDSEFNSQIMEFV